MMMTTMLMPTMPDATVQPVGRHIANHVKCETIQITLWLLLLQMSEVTGQEPFGLYVTVVASKSFFSAFTLIACDRKGIQTIKKLVPLIPPPHTTILRPSWILSGSTRVSWHQTGKTRKVKPIWIYWSKR